MKKLILSPLSILSAALLLTGCVLVGCTSMMESVKGKTVNLQTEVYGMRVTACDPSTGATTPSGEIGFGAIDYHSAPMSAGQRYYVRRSTNSLWTSSPASETVIWIGQAADTGLLEVEAVPAGVVKLDADGVTLGESATVTVTPSGSGTGILPVGDAVSELESTLTDTPATD